MKSTFFSFLFFIIAFHIKAFSVNIPAVSDSLNYYIQIVDQPQNADELIKAYKFFVRKKEFAESINDINSVVYANIQLSRIELKIGLPYESEILAVKALEQINAHPDSIYLNTLKNSVYNHLGILYRSQKNISKSIELYHKVLSQANSVRDTAIVFNNMSNAYKDVADYAKAKKELIKAYQLIPRLSDVSLKAKILDNLGALKLKIGDSSAIYDLKKALNLLLKNGDTVKAYYNYKNLANYYLTKDTLKAKSFGLKAYAIANSMNNLSNKRDVLAILSELDAKTYFKTFMEVDRVLSNRKALQANKFALMKYDVSKKEKELQEKEQQTRLYLYLVLLIVLITIAFFYILSVKHKKDRLKQVLQTESRISKKIHDEVANDMYQIMVKAQAQEQTNILLDDLEAVYLKTRDISKENSVINTSQNFKETLQDLIASYDTSDVNIVTQGLSKIPWQSLSHLKKVTLYRVLQELLTNMKKHSKASLVMLVFNKEAKLNVKYTDNGVGCSLIKQSGLQNMETRIKAIQGSITFETRKQAGFKANILI
ncbi:hypothetical protein GCM10022271_19680 [Corallibacter vietnamensis]|uniref:histidine kinase n=1 Tax=Corallibacter vietnamensis TaxID=904130 RepID=A0ABP7HCR0_9FLAO